MVAARHLTATTALMAAPRPMTPPAGDSRRRPRAAAKRVCAWSRCLQQPRPPTLARPACLPACCRSRVPQALPGVTAPGSVLTVRPQFATPRDVAQRVGSSVRARARDNE
jgi:hypothetical protein